MTFCLIMLHVIPAQAGIQELVMDYFKILNLKKEPFSNSPEPGFFFQSEKHLGCLQKLELAVRLKRGLNVVIGEVGTGKTTLCRQLILRFSSSEEDKRQIETHLLMDPAFTNTLEFLSTIAMTMGTKQDDDTEWQLKEKIKKYLFSKSLEEGKIVLLIIDEGQKLPDFCLEILREFLNYETDEFKLLQIVIFAQTEFNEIIKQKPNFADRVNLSYFLRPLSFRETVAMVRYRIAKASETDAVPVLFNYSGLLALYLTTGGYPRKIVTLCHQVVLAMIIQNKSRAGWFLVRSSDRRVKAVQRLSLKFRVAFTLFLLLVAVTATGLFYDIPGVVRNVKEIVSITENRSSAVVQSEMTDREMQTEKMPVHEAVAKTVPIIPSEKKIIPELLGRVALKSGRTVWRMLSDFYGDFDQEILTAVAQKNPHIKNLNHVPAGQTIKLPAIPSSRSPLTPGKMWVVVAQGKNIEDVYELYRSYESVPPFVKFLPYFNERDGLIFAVFVKNGFDSQEAAENMIRKLPKALSVNARIQKKIADDTVFFAK